MTSVAFVSSFSYYLILFPNVVPNIPESVKFGFLENYDSLILTWSPPMVLGGIIENYIVSNCFEALLSIPFMYIFLKHTINL